MKISAASGSVCKWLYLCNIMWETHLLFKQLKLLTLNKIHDVESNVFEKLDFYLIILRYLHVVKCMHVSIEILHMCDINGKLTLQGNFMLVSPFMNNYFYKQKCRQTILIERPEKQLFNMLMSSVTYMWDA